MQDALTAVICPRTGTGGCLLSSQTQWPRSLGAAWPTPARVVKHPSEQITETRPYNIVCICLLRVYHCVCVVGWVAQGG